MLNNLVKILRGANSTCGRRNLPHSTLLKGTGGFVWLLLLGSVIGVKTEMRVLTEKQFGFVQG